MAHRNRISPTLRALEIQAVCAAAFCFLLALIALFIRKHKLMAVAGSWTLGKYIGKDWESDPDGTAYWIEYEFEGINGGRVKAGQGLMGGEWELAGPDWKTVVFRHPDRPEVYLTAHQIAMLPRDRG